MNQQRKHVSDTPSPAGELEAAPERDGMTCKDSMRYGSQQLDGHSPTAALDARVLLSHVLRKDEAWLIAHDSEIIEVDHSIRYAELLARRRRGEPVAHITGSREFWSLQLAVSPSVLIPRPETELLVELALRRIPADADWRIADLGTGSGAVALAIAIERPRCQVIATDRSHGALQLAKRNARELGIGNVAFVAGSWCLPLAALGFELIVSNPPYVADDDPHLREGDLVYEPPLALRAGPSGLDALAVIAAQAREILTAPGWLLVEHGFGQQSTVAKLLTEAGGRDILCHRDHAGLPRVTECRLCAADPKEA